MASGVVKVCGNRGLMAWCPSCADWTPLVLERKTDHPPGSEGPELSGANPRDTRFRDSLGWHTVERGGFCGNCLERLPKIKTYAESAKKEAQACPE